MMNMGPECGFVEKTPRSSARKTEKKRNNHIIIVAVITGIVLFAGMIIAYTGTQVGSQSEIEYRATATHVVINEVYYDAPTGYSEPECEWVELYNPTDQEIDISGWKLADGPNDTAAEGNWTFPTGATIPAESYILIVNDATYNGEFNELFPGITPDYDTNTSNSIPDVITGGTFSLANTGDDVHLFDASGVEIDAMWYGNGGDMGSTNAAEDVSAGHSLARYFNAEDTDNPSYDFYDETTPTPGAQNSQAIPELQYIGIFVALISIMMVTKFRKRK